MSIGSNDAVIREIARDVFGVDGADLADVGIERVWPTAVELGWALVGIEHVHGGAGGSLLDLGSVVSALGRHGAAIPLLEQSLAAWALTFAGQGMPEDLVTVADPHACDLTVTGEGRVSGRAHSVPWATHAARAVLTASADGVQRLVVIDLGDGVVRHEETVAGEPRSELELDGVAATALEAGPEVSDLFHRGALLSTAALVGAMEAAFELTRTYVTEREQFGRPLARLQVVGSSLAEMSSHVSLARSALDAALCALDASDPHADFAVAVARVTAVGLTTPVGELAHLLHGAMGITREYPLHRATRRIWSWRDEWGTERWWRRTLGERVLASGPEQFWDEATTLATIGI